MLHDPRGASGNPDRRQPSQHLHGQSASYYPGEAVSGIRRIAVSAPSSLASAAQTFAPELFEFAAQFVRFGCRFFDFVSGFFDRFRNRFFSLLRAFA